MLRLMLAAALLAAATGAGCLQDLTGAASPAAEAVREAVHGRVLEARARIRLYEAPLRLPGLWFLPAPAVPKQTALAEGQRVLVTRIRDTGRWNHRAVWLQIASRRTSGWIRLAPHNEAEQQLWNLFRKGWRQQPPARPNARTNRENLFEAATGR